MTGEIGNTAQVLQLAARLEATTALAEFTARRGGAPSAHYAMEVATCIADVARASDRIVRVELPRVLAESVSDEEASDALHAIGEELRHILYHITHTAYYGYLVPESPRVE